MLRHTRMIHNVATAKENKKLVFHCGYCEADVILTIEEFYKHIHDHEFGEPSPDDGEVNI